MTAIPVIMISVPINVQFCVIVVMGSWNRVKNVTMAIHSTEIIVQINARVIPMQNGAGMALNLAVRNAMTAIMSTGMAVLPTA